MIHIGLWSNGFGAPHHGNDTIGRKSIRLLPISDKETHPTKKQASHHGLRHNGDFGKC
jgi:hypothetical protein